MRVICFPEEEKAIRKVPYKDGGFIRLTRRWEELKVILIEFGRKLRMLCNFVLIRTGIEGENDNVRIMFRRKEVSTSNIDMAGYPIC